MADTSEKASTAGTVIKTIIVIGVLGAFAYLLFRGFSITCIDVWNGQPTRWRLPIYMLFGFAAGVIPLFVWHTAKVWSLKREIKDMRENMAPQTKA